ncbi:MAG: AAA family ATPase [Rickettsiaceae bacterium]|nr:AAA family ATPase [Rickettsiaceae bacterium]
MLSCYKNNYYVITGAPGSGKSTLINSLRKEDYICVDEPAREIIAEQKAINGQGLYNKNKKLFLKLMLSRSICRYNQWNDIDKPIVFDRGMPDVIGYAKLFELDPQPFIKASQICKYNNKIFFLPSWREIYSNDEDRTMSFDDAKMFGDLIEQSYIDLDYNIITVQLVSIDKRVEFISDILNR